MPAVREIGASGYRSLKQIRFPVEGLTVFVGGNGTGKTNLYRALELLQAAASGTLTRSLAAEGGMESVLWAGERRRTDPARVRLCADLLDDATGHGFVYEVEVGLVQQAGGVTFGAAFALEPQIKAERLTVRTGVRPVVTLSRDGPSGFVRDEDGKKRPFGTTLLATETALSALQDAARFPELQIVRQAMLAWRFYHDVRTDAGSALRRPCLAVTTPTLASDGADLAAAFATLAHIRQDTADLEAGSTTPFRVHTSSCPSLAGRRASAWFFRTTRSASSRPPNSRTARCATSRSRARCSPTALPGAQRAGDQPASGPDGATRRNDPAGRAAHAGLARHPFRAARPGDRRRGRPAPPRRGQTRRRDLDRGPAARRGFFGG